MALRDKEMWHNHRKKISFRCHFLVLLPHKYGGHYMDYSPSFLQKNNNFGDGQSFFSCHHLKERDMDYPKSVIRP